MNRRTDPGAPTTEPPRRRTPPRPREGVPGKLRLNLQDLRVETFETTRPVHAPECGACTGCTDYTGCSDCTACTRCSWPTCIHTVGDGGACQPGTAP